MPPVRPALNPHDLTIPEPGSTTARTVLTGALAQLLRDLPTIGRGFPISPAMQQDLHQFHILRQELTTKQRGALPSFLARTPIGTLVRCLRHQPSEELLREFVSLVYFELARVGALEGPIHQKCPPKRILSLAGRIRITLPNEAQAILYKPGKLVVEMESGQVELDLDTYDDKPAGYTESVGGVIVEKPYHVVDKNIVLALADNNPLAMFDAHPDKQGNAIDLGGKTASEWTNVLRDGLQLIAAMLPDLRAEMDLFVQQIVPVGFDEQKHLSASYQEAIGTIYMSLHPSLMTMTEALIHEFSHNKINALFELDGVLENAFSPLYTSPVRPDPRPLHGVLLAVHAFLPVARLYEKMVESGHPLAQNSTFLGRFAKIRQINAEGAQVVLQHGRPTPVGKPLLDEIRRWDGYYDTYGKVRQDPGPMRDV